VTSPALDAAPVWSPDGREIAFASERTGKSERAVYVARSDGTNVRLLAKGMPRTGYAASLPSWGARPAGDVCTIDGTVHADRLVGTPHSDVICGGGGNDTIFARGGGRDVVYGGAGRDTAHVDRRDRLVGVERRLYR
jgi:dipeptidyl aminopeptidase/acylaminoacyl peptidase